MLHSRQWVKLQFSEMKSFSQYISENWSHATPEDLSNENAHKYIFHTTSEKNAKKIVKQGRLEPRPPKKNILSTLKYLKQARSMYSGERNDGDNNPFADNIQHFERRLKNTYVLRSGGNEKALRAALDNYGEMKGSSVVKYPIANLSRNMARRLKIDYEGSKVADMTDEEDVVQGANPVALTVQGPIENRYKK